MVRRKGEVRSGGKGRRCGQEKRGGVQLGEEASGCGTIGSGEVQSKEGRSISDLY